MSQVIILNDNQYGYDRYEKLKLDKDVYIVNTQGLRPISSFITEDILKKLFSYSAYLILVEDGEAHNWSILKDKLKETLKGIDSKQVLIVSSNPLFSSKQLSFSRDTIPYKVFYYNSCMDWFKNNLNNNKEFSLDIKNHFSFLSFTDKDFRRYIFYKLHKNNLIQNNIVSHVKDVKNFFQNDYFFDKQIRDSMCPLEFNDFKEITGKKIDLFQGSRFEKGFFDPSDNCGLELINETTMDAGSFFITESTLKPIIAKRMFLMCGPPKLLSFLRFLGFKTFNHVFDESYDDILDKKRRIDKIISILSNFCSLSLDEVIKIKKDNREILEYNYNHLISMDLSFDITKKIESHFKGEINGRN